MESETRVSRILNGLKNHRFISAIIIFGVVVIALGAFTDGLQKIVEGAQSVWQSTNPEDHSAMPITGSLGVLLFWSDNDCSGDALARVPLESGMERTMRELMSTNDAARSVELLGVPAGVVIRLFDSPDGSMNDDWTEIRVRQAIERTCLRSFEESIDDNEWLKVVHHRHDGLDGKVSLVTVVNGP